MMPEMKTLNGYEVVDAKARQDIEDIMGANLASEEYVDEAIAAIPKPDYTGLATEAYVDNAIDNIPEVDLSKHALKSELPTKVSQLQNDSKFITREEVPETDLSAYAKKSEIPDVSDFITSIPSEYITESELNAKGYLTQHQDISGKADKNHKHTEYLTEHQDISHLAPKSSIPTKVSQLANDSNYLTSIPSTYITEAELEAKNYLTEHQSLAAYATKTFVENTVAENQPNLSGYAKKSDIPDVSDFISEIPSEYVTDSELAAKKYATESYVGEAIAQAQLGGEEVDLSDYAKKADVPTKTSQLTNDSNFFTAIPSEYVTETELNNKGYLTQHQSLDGKADKVHEHTEYANKTHNHSMADITDYVAPEIPSLEGYATEKYVDDAVAGIDIPESTPEVYHLDMRGVAGSVSVNAPDSHIEVLNKVIAGDPICIYIRLSDMETWPASTCKYSDTSVVIETTPGHNANTGDAFKEICSYSLENGVWKLHKTSPSTPKMVTETELTNTLANYASTSYVDEVAADNTTAYQLVYGAAGSVVTDEKTIACLEAAFAGVLPLCNINNRRVISTIVMSDGVKLLSFTPQAGSFYTTSTCHLFEKSGDTWTYKNQSSYNGYHYTKTSQLTNDANFATESYVDEAVAGINVPDTSTFATQEYVDTEVASISGASSKKPVYEFEYDDLTNTSFVNLLNKITDGSKKVEDYELYLIDKSPNLANWGTQDYAKVRIMSCTCQGFLSNAPQTMFGLWMDSDDGNFVAISYAYQGTKNYDTGTYSYTVTRKAIKLSGTVM